MSTVSRWARHYQEGWGEQAGNPRLPLWLRVACLAYCHHRANGHAVFRQREIRLVLSTVDRTTGVISEPEADAVSRAIATAVDYGWLDRQSTARCLVVPAHRITGGLGEPDELCPQHRRPDRPQRRLSIVTEAAS